MLKFFVVFLSAISVILAKSLPSYLKPCSLSDPKLEECMIKHGQEAIPKFIEGDKEYSVPNLNPLLIDKVNFNAGSLRIKFSDMLVSGLETAQVVAAGFEPQNQKMTFDLIIPKVDIKAQYKTNGRILLLPFEGSGPVNIILYDGRYNCSIILNNFTPNNKKPLSYKSSEVKFYVQDSHYKFENLFNGNKLLGDNINQVLNENHDNLDMEFNGVFAETINTVVRTIISGVVKDVYFKDIFDP